MCSVSDRRGQIFESWSVKVDRNFLIIIIIRTCFENKQCSKQFAASSPVYFYILYRLFQNKNEFMDCYVKNVAKRIVKTDNLLCNFMVAVSLAPELYIYIYIYLCFCLDYPACKSHPFGNITFKSLTVSLDSMAVPYSLWLSKKHGFRKKNTLNA
jgi:hypothetical protein